MLSRTDRVVRETVRRRKQMGLSQAEAARQVGVVPSYLAQIELGLRPPSRRVLEALEVVYRVRRRKYTDQVTFPGRGRKRLNAPARSAIRNLEERISNTSTVQGTMNRFARQGTGIKNTLWPMALHLGPHAQLEVEELERLRAGDDRFWTLFNRVALDSWSERRFMVRLGLAGGEMVRLAPGRLGVSLSVVHERTGRYTGLCARPAMVLQRDGLSAAFMPQCSVRVQSGVRRLDFLVVVSNGRRRAVIDLELDGPQHHPVRDRKRQTSIGLPTLRIPVDRVGDTDVVQRLFSALSNYLAER